MKLNLNYPNQRLGDYYELNNYSNMNLPPRHGSTALYGHSRKKAIGFSSMMGADLSLPGIDSAMVHKRKLASSKFNTYQELQGGLGQRSTVTWAEGHDFGRMAFNRSELAQQKKDLQIIPQKEQTSETYRNSAKGRESGNQGRDPTIDILLVNGNAESTPDDDDKNEKKSAENLTRNK